MAADSVRAESPQRSAAGERTSSRAISQHQQRHLREEGRAALRALLMTPLMTPAHPEFVAVRRHADELRDWFSRETGWDLHIAADCARLFKRPAELGDPTRGLPGYDRRRYVVLCLAAAVLERADPQITLRMLGERVLGLAADPAMTATGFSFTLEAQHERRELVAVCRSLLEWGILRRVAGDEESYIHRSGETSDVHHDALYDVQRRVLAGLMAAIRGPSTWAAADAPPDTESRIGALVAEHVPDSDEGRRTALRHALSRRLLDDPVVYLDTLDAAARAYFINQRGPMAARLAEASGLLPEQRAEGLALVDESGTLTDVAMPAEGTEAHVTLLVAAYLAGRGDPTGAAALTRNDVAEFVGRARQAHGMLWRKSARESGAERELAATALDRLRRLHLVAVDGNEVRALPALARFAFDDAEIA